MSLLGTFYMFLLAAAVLPNQADATYGVDISTLVSENSFSCMKSNGFDFSISRCWHSSGTPDRNVVASVANAWKGGMAHVDVYMVS